MFHKIAPIRATQVQSLSTALPLDDPDRLIEKFQAADAIPQRDRLVEEAIHAVIYDGINTGLPIGSPVEEKLMAYQRIYDYQLRRELGLPSDALGAVVKEAMSREINKAVGELRGSVHKTIARRERQFLKLSEQASEEEVAQARKIPAVNQRRRYGLPDDVPGWQLEEAIIQARDEAIRVFLGLPKQATELEVIRAAAEEKALDQETPADEIRLLLELSECASSTELDQAICAAYMSRMQRYHAKTKEQLMQFRAAAAQTAQRVALGLSSSASELDIAMADSEDAYTSRRRSAGLPEDAPAMHLEQVGKQQTKNQPLTICPMMR